MSTYITRNRQPDGVLDSVVQVWKTRPTRYVCSDDGIRWGFYDFTTKEWDFRAFKCRGDLLWCLQEYGTIPDNDRMILKKGRRN